MDDFKQDIRLQEAVTDKLIMADAMSNRRPKVIPLHRTFEMLFPEKEQKQQSPEEIVKRMRATMRTKEKSGNIVEKSVLT